MNYIPRTTLKTVSPVRPWFRARMRLTLATNSVPPILVYGFEKDTIVVNSTTCVRHIRLALS